jgi:hypothetical protein
MEAQVNVETVQPMLSIPTQDAPRCCRHAMDVLSRRAILHGDGEVEFASVWYCPRCGQLVL